MLILIAGCLLVILMLMIFCMLWTSVDIEISITFDQNEQQAIVHIRWLAFCIMKKHFSLKEKQSNPIQELAYLVESNHLQDVKTTINHIQKKISNWWSL